MSIGTYINLYTPKGRIIKGSTSELVTVEYKWDEATRRYITSPLPEDKHKYTIHLAVRKDNLETTKMLQAIYEYCVKTYAQYPTVITAINRLLTPLSGFSWKMYDGDIVNKNTGKADPNSKGCWVMQFDTRPPREFRTIAWDNTPIPTTDVKCGYECDVAFSIIDNGKTVSIPGGASAGIYLNASFIRYLGTGEEIVYGPSPDQLLPPAAPPPARAFPVVVSPNDSASTAAQAPVNQQAVASPAPSVRPTLPTADQVLAVVSASVAAETVTAIPAGATALQQEPGTVSPSNISPVKGFAFGAPVI